MTGRFLWAVAALLPCEVHEIEKHLVFLYRRTIIYCYLLAVFGANTGLVTKATHQFFKGSVIIYLRVGEGGWGAKDLRLNKVKFSQSLPFKVTSLKRSPLITFNDFRYPPPPICLHFPSKFQWFPPLNPSKVFSDSPFWVLSYDWSPLFLTQKSCDIPPKILPLPPRR